MSKSPSPAMAKGNALELGVLAIEGAILRSHPQLKEKTFSIEHKKLVNYSGVRHEIDIYVNVDLRKGYQSLFIFECKNWESKVGKNVVIVFSEKISVTGATKGFFVAKSYTRDARSQAKRDPRIELIEVEEHAVHGVPVPLDFHILANEPRHTNIELHQITHDGREGYLPVEVSSAMATLDGEIVDLSSTSTNGKWRRVRSALRPSRQGICQQATTS